jgi:hypothetical protein
MSSFWKTAIAILVLASSPTLSIAPVVAQEAPDWAVEPCVNEVAQYGVTVEEIIDVITGKGGATLTMTGYNEAGVPVTFVCTYTIDTDEVVVEYQ